ncbi:phage tail protein [Sphingomonas sp. CJ20]
MQQPCEVLVGGVIAFAGDVTSPAGEASVMSQGWVPCDGRSLSMAEYPLLYAVIGGQPGDPEGYFTLPDYRDVAPLGAAGGGPRLTYLIRYRGGARVWPAPRG